MKSRLRFATPVPVPVRPPCVKVCETDPDTQRSRGCCRAQEERDRASRSMDLLCASAAGG